MPKAMAVEPKLIGHVTLNGDITNKLATLAGYFIGTGWGLHVREDRIQNLSVFRLHGVINRLCRHCCYACF